MCRACFRLTGGPAFHGLGRQGAQLLGHENGQRPRLNDALAPLYRLATRAGHGYVVKVMTFAPVLAALGKVGGPSFAHRGGGGSSGGTGGLALGLLLALLLGRVDAFVNQHGQTARFAARLLDSPGAHVANGAADGLPVQLRFENE